LKTLLRALLAVLAVAALVAMAGAVYDFFAAPPQEIPPAGSGEP